MPLAPVAYSTVMSMAEQSASGVAEIESMLSSEYCCVLQPSAVYAMPVQPAPYGQLAHEQPCAVGAITVGSAKSSSGATSSEAWRSGRRVASSEARRSGRRVASSEASWCRGRRVASSEASWCRGRRVAMTAIALSLLRLPPTFACENGAQKEI